jgi:hypothetical protein
LSYSLWVERQAGRLQWKPYIVQRILRHQMPADDSNPPRDPNRNLRLLWCRGKHSFYSHYRRFGRIRGMSGPYGPSPGHSRHLPIGGRNSSDLLSASTVFYGIVNSGTFKRKTVARWYKIELFSANVRADWRLSLARRCLTVRIMLRVLQGESFSRGINVESSHGFRRSVRAGSLSP